MSTGWCAERNWVVTSRKIFYCRSPANPNVDIKTPAFNPVLEKEKYENQIDGNRSPGAKADHPTEKFYEAIPLGQTFDLVRALAAGRRLRVLPQ
jgi:hypothetical protein